MLVDPTPILADKIQFLPGKTLASLKFTKKDILKLHPPRHLFFCVPRYGTGTAWVWVTWMYLSWVTT